MKLEFFRDFRKNIKYQISSDPSRVKLLHADRQLDGRTDIMLIAAFRNFANSLKKYNLMCKNICQDRLDSTEVAERFRGRCVSYW